MANMQYYLSQKIKHYIDLIWFKLLLDLLKKCGFYRLQYFMRPPKYDQNRSLLDSYKFPIKTMLVYFVSKIVDSV